MDASTTAEEKLFYEAGGVVPDDIFEDWKPGSAGLWDFTIDILQDHKSFSMDDTAFASLPNNSLIMSFWQKID